MTVQEAAEKWGVSVRRVQFLCEKEIIPGVVRFGKVWAIPNEAEKPKDGRYKAHKRI
jgi:hypothetical protein